MFGPRPVGEKDSVNSVEHKQDTGHPVAERDQTYGCLWVVAMDILHGQLRTQESTEDRQGQAKEDVAATLPAMPMLAGPGAIATIIVLAGQARTVPAMRKGQTGIRVMTRIMGLLLAAIAVQFVITGVCDALRGTLPS